MKCEHYPLNISDPAHVDRTEVIHTYTEVTGSPSQSPKVFQECLRTTTTTTTKTTKVLTPRTQEGDERPIPGRGVEITELASDDELESHIIPEDHHDEVEQHVVVTQQQTVSAKPERIAEESEEEAEHAKPIEVEDESLTNQTPISLASRDQSERVEASANGDDDEELTTEEIVSTRIYGGEIVDDIISQAVSRVNDVAPDEEEEELDRWEEEKDVAVEPQTATTVYDDYEEESSGAQQQDDYDFEKEYEADIPQVVAEETIDVNQDSPNEPEREDSEEPSSKSDPISVTSPDEDESPPLAGAGDPDSAPVETGPGETEDIEPATASAPATGGKKNKNRKKKGKRGGGGGN